TCHAPRQSLTVVRPPQGPSRPVSSRHICRTAALEPINPVRRRTRSSARPQLTRLGLLASPVCAIPCEFAHEPSHLHYPACRRLVIQRSESPGRAPRAGQGGAAPGEASRGGRTPGPEPP